MDDTVRTGIQLYTLRDLEGGLPTLLRRVGETDFDGVEFAGFGETSPEEAGAEWLLYEHDAPSDPAASLEHGARALEALCD